MALKDDKPIVNRAARSRTLTIEMDEMFAEAKLATLDLASWLWQGIALKEDLFRQSIADFDWSQYQNQFVRIYCSEDAIIPSWAYMLVASELQANSRGFYFGDEDAFQAFVITSLIDALDLDDYRDKRVIIKGCGSLAIGPQLYAHVTAKLTPVVRSLMFGEPCSTVPIFRKER